MLKSMLSLLVVVGFAVSANAAPKEIQINGSYGAPAIPGGPTSGTNASIGMNDDGSDSSTSIGLGAEVYFGMSDQLQVGALVGYTTSEFGVAEVDTMSLGALVRYNLSSELRDSVFVGGGVRYMDMDMGGTSADNIALLLSVGKRYALSETITWTPNVTVALNIGGDLDEGHNINLNLLSFSGFMD